MPNSTLHNSLVQKSKYKLVVLYLLAIFACKPEFTLDHAPPSDKVPVAQVFPSEIMGQKAKLQKIVGKNGVLGFAADYGTNNRIEVYQIISKQEKEAVQYFEKQILPFFKKQESHYSKKIGGKPAAYAKDKQDRLYYAWVNQNWIFHLMGNSSKEMQAIVKKFSYISD
ncbi:MAG: hypothetical protein AAF518_06010 [Spirochaetota bacterium]